MRNKEIRHTKLTLIALAMSTVFLLPGVARADGDLAVMCDYEMQKVFEAIDNGDFLGRVTIGYSDYDVRDQQRMHDKWHEAVKKLNHGKYDDAYEKLTTIRDKASKLVEGRNKAKLRNDAEINTAVGAALACIP